MNPVSFEMLVALTMLVTSAVLVVVFLRHRTAVSARRTTLMLAHAGVDPEVASCADQRPVMRDVRRRCRSCSQESYCDRWLSGEAPGDDAFCPNARVFQALARRGRAV